MAETWARFRSGIVCDASASELRGIDVVVLAEGEGKPADGFAWRPDLRPRLVVDPLRRAAACEGAAGLAPGAVHIFTDGSTGRNHVLPTGCAIVRALPGGAVATQRFACARGGDNFCAELCGVVAALQDAPAHVELHIHTDSAAAIGSVDHGRVRLYGGVGGTPVLSNVYALSQRRCLLAACRPMVTLARQLVSARSGKVVLTKVKAHAVDGGVRSVLNAVADAEANAARLAAAEGPPMDWELAGEENVRVRLPNRRGPGCGAVVIGSIRRALLRRADRDALFRLSALPHQGRLAAQCGTLLLQAFQAVRKVRHPGLLAFFLEAATEWLPTERRLWVRKSDAGRGESCKLCGDPCDTSAHVLGWCPFWRIARVREAVLTDVVALHRAAVDPANCWEVPAYFDMTGRTRILLPAAMTEEQVRAIAWHSPLAGLIGIPPPHHDVALRAAGESLADTQARAQAVSMRLVWGALDIWMERMDAMQALVESGAHGYADGLLDAAVARKRKRAAADQQRAAVKFFARSARACAVQAFKRGGLPLPDRPRRSLLARTRSALAVGDMVSEITSDEEREEAREALLRGGGIVFPTF